MLTFNLNSKKQIQKILLFKINRKTFLILFFLLFFIYCKEEKATEIKELELPKIEKETSLVIQEKKLLDSNNPNVHDSSFVAIANYSQAFEYDLKYATTDNFLNQKVYDCPDCYLRVSTVKALLQVNDSLQKLGYHIKFFDCYRPFDVQKKMWKIMPNTNYVANPKRASVHNRGGAIDITLVDDFGKELDMGTPFDHFGKEAYQNYSNLPEDVLKNRKLLKTIMEHYNFKSIYSEWWHYEFRPDRHAKVSNFKWECE